MADFWTDEEIKKLETLISKAAHQPTDHDILERLREELRLMRREVAGDHRLNRYTNTFSLLDRLEEILEGKERP